MTQTGSRKMRKAVEARNAAALAYEEAQRSGDYVAVYHAKNALDWANMTVANVARGVL